ncbi:hypothetical protein [Actinoplanes sp. NPDC049118]|uniref:hypothetical protein n=1 Tax=Actinoplanes sp. NPDC049118 TaxID=3155769 RepID=UPI0033E68068
MKSADKRRRHMVRYAGNSNYRRRGDMNKATRIAVVGLSLLAGATLGMAPAQASPSTGQATASSSVVQQQGDRYWNERGVVGYYRFLGDCRRAGFYGDRIGAWWDFECVFVRWGIRRGAWALVVGDRYWDNGWDDRWRPGYWPGNWPYRPVWRPGVYGGGGGYDGGGGYNGGGGFNNNNNNDNGGGWNDDQIEPIDKNH